MNNYILGLDIGITSVGYGIVDSDTREIKDAGVRLFPEANVDNNEGRRSKRGARRLKRRRIHRLDRVKHLLAEYDLLDLTNIPKSTNPYQTRVKGLNEKLSKDELVIALLHIAKRRGIHNVNVMMDDNDSGNELSTKDQLKKNAKALSDKYVCELQLERFEQDYKVRGEKNRFKTEDFVREARKLLETQSKFFEIDQTFIMRYIELIETRREYFEGPGKGSPFGWEGNIKKWFEQMMGHCTYFPEELRSVKYSYSAELFNALNDLNNLVITRDEDAKLNYGEKFQIIENVFKQKKTPNLKQIAIEIGVHETEIKGYRVNKSGKPEFTQFKLYHDLKNIFEDPKYLNDIQLMDNIAEIITIYQDAESIIKELNQLPELLSEREKEKISALSGYSGTHRLSLKCINLLLDDLWESSLNQMELFTKLNLKPKKIDLSQQHKIPSKLVDDFILSPVVKRAFIQSIQVVNAIIDKYGLPEDIIIELARENNSDDRRKFLNQLQKQNEETRKQVEKVLREYGNDNAKRIVQKIKLHNMQEGKCLYSLKDIPLEDLLRNPHHYEVDHIIPRSVAFDNSMHNKVLVRADENSKKGNRTPYQYLNSSESSLSYNEFKQHILNLSKTKDRITKKKREYLLEERDINKFDVQKEFINRNLVDTRYATRELTSLLKAYFSANNLDVKVKTINGSFTNYLRKVWKFDKDRNKGYKHHAEDALIIANADFLFKHNKKLRNINKVLDAPSKEVDKKRVTVQSEDEYNQIFEDTQKAQAIKKFEIRKFSHRVDKKPNRQLINDTLYSTRNIDGIEYVVESIKDIYSVNNDKVKTKFKKDPHRLLMYRNDPQTFEKFEKVFKQYESEKNPFAKYYEETGEKIRKFSKTGQGPYINKIKYLRERLGRHCDVTNKYINSRNKIVQLKIYSYRFDIYQYGNNYKMITISYIDLEQKSNYYYISREKYEQKKKDKQIDDSYKFIGSFYKNDIINYNGEMYRVIGVNDSEKNKIQLDMIDISIKDYMELNNIKKTGVIYKTIGKSTTHIEKYTTDILGNLYKAAPPKKPQLIFKRGME
ncbi:type II CRISPR RNA-guided endonuclease Cas9 [Staphylococcus hyicus]|uniref:Type II CRISPR RNA-guided endonuclease Cas9 n=1 Tax=Staphylococcus hyicus TaxID=1284 RepID=A0ACD5FQ62_STAHY|nr:type II CRISPR RNA-guided endonuclease Cas9 [Staphylococcus hyicus]MCE5154449.1 type II CRISPR RNA-guided endonuclease Cas9 [Staphylococcus hyicus]MCQ9300696.1 type II CRISPR RNA-guided endonuclease Cas9 [Staphylococcus hyicus]MDP4461415.1 type II CRISPR RNA-guided endonuclease Cas9 [Staphylococcus hyicus]MDP4464309.1 type II CRISPR RNA-guided endonuclease Cas9 [Staphylococcus hyicus]